MKLTPAHKVKPGNAGEAFKNRVKKNRKKKDAANKAKAKQRKSKR